MGEDQSDFNYYDTNKIAFIGDKLTSDILYGNENNMLTIWLTDIE